MNRRDRTNLYLQEVQEVFPEIRVSSAFSMYSGDLDEPTTGKIELSNKIVCDPNTMNSAVSFIHYTSLNSFINIINSGKIRLYNCLNMNDSKEINFGLREFDVDITEEELLNFKQNHFILSGSKYEEGKTEDFNLWRLYGDNSNGIALILEITPKIHNWVGLFCNEISYFNTDVNYKKFREFARIHKEFNKKIPLFENVPNLIPLMALFVKNAIWSVEKEYRIVSYCPFDRYSLTPKSNFGSNTSPALSDTLEHSINSKGDLVSYVELPLTIKNHPSKDKKVESPFKKETINLEDYLPHLTLKGVVLGPNHTKLSSGLSDFLFEVCPKKLGYRFQINLSTFSD